MTQAPNTKPKARRLEPWRWALPQEVEVPPDRLQARVDFFSEAIVLHLVEKSAVTTRLVSAADIASVFTRELPLQTGILPPEALWWANSHNGPVVALWRAPRVWPVAIQMEAFKPAERFRVPMPGLVFICQPGRPPWVYASKARPTSAEDQLYQAPLFNVFANGLTCQGTHSYPAATADVPESFFLSFFSPAGATGGRSRKHPQDLLQLWRELDGKRRYPLDDLVLIGTVERVIEHVWRNGT